MLRTADLVFDEVVESSDASLTTFYTDVKWNARMGVPDVVQVMYLGVQATAGAQLTAYFDGSPDQVNWNPGTTALINNGDLTITTPQSTAYFTNGGPYVRLRFTVSGSTTTSCKLRIWWIGRDFAL